MVSNDESETIQKLREGLSKWEDMFFNKDYPPIGSVTEEMRSENQRRIVRGSVRMHNAEYRTDDEYAKYIEETTSLKLP